MEINEDIIKSLIGFKPKEIELYKNAFVHKSLVKETNSSSNERLEFVGDSVISIIVAEYLYTNYPNENEGFLTRIRTKIVCSKGLSYLAEKLELHKFIKMNAKAMAHNWNTNTRILEDAFESLMGAFYLDRGLEPCKKFLIRLIKKYVEDETLIIDTNYKEILMKFLQQKNLKLPIYNITHQTGPDHNKIFTVQISVNERKICEGTDKNKKQAEQNAAYLALKCLGYFK